MGFEDPRIDALVDRKDLNDPHAAAMWDLKISGMDALVGRKDLNNPHAAAMWDLLPGIEPCQFIVLAGQTLFS